MCYVCHCEWVAIDSAVNNFLCLTNLSQGKGSIRYHKLVTPELADPGIPPPRVKTETFYRKNNSAAVPRASRATSAGFSLLVTFTRISFVERLLVVYSGSLRPCRGVSGVCRGPGQTLTGEMTQFCETLRDSRANVKCAECLVSGHGGIRETRAVTG